MGSAPGTSHKTLVLNSCYFQKSQANVIGTATCMKDHSALCHTFNPHLQNPKDKFLNPDDTWFININAELIHVKLMN